MQSPVVLPSPSPIQSTPPQSKFFSSPVPRFQTNYQKNNSHTIYNATQFRPHTPVQQGVEFDGKRLRKAVVRKTIDYNAASVRQLELRIWQRDRRDARAIQPDSAYYTQMVPPPFFVHNPINAVTTKFVRTSTNKMRCPIFCVAWTPEGRRLVTGASSGEFTLWNGLTFNFETILQAHDSPVRCMVWSHTDQWMVTGDHAGFVKYWQSNMNNVKMFQAHKEPLRGISFCPTDTKFATCSDDGTVRIWDFLKYHEERILRGHGADVKCVAWHPHKALLVSGSKDSQQPIKLWDPKSGQSLATLHAHKSTVMEAKWNDNGNWLLTGSRDHLIKLFDIRKLSQEVQTFRGHKKEVSSLAWHPVHESLFASGGSDGAVMFWLTGVDKEVGSMEQAHDSIVWSLAWHPLGHILCSGSNDHTCKFWTRNRPGDKMRDKYNLNMMVGGGNPDDISEYDDIATAPSIPGMGLDQNHVIRSMDQMESDYESAAIPGLDFGSEEPQMQMDRDKGNIQKKIPYSKPIPKQFQQQWMDNKRPLIGAPPGNSVLNPPPSSQGTDGPPPSMMVPPPPPPHMMNPPPGSQGFGPPQGPPPRMGMMWGPRMPGPDGQIRAPPPPFPPHMGNGTQFRPPPNPPPPRFGDGNTVNTTGETKNWKEFGDSDFRVPMDSDLRMLGNKGQGPDGQQQPQHQENNSYSEESRDSNLSGDGQDQDMRSPQDTDARVTGFQPGSASANSVPLNEGRTSGRRGGRWGPFTGGGGGGPFNPPPGSNFSNEGGDRDLRRGMEGDWDERIAIGMMPNSEGGNSSGGGNNSGNLPGPPLPNTPPPFQGQRKRGWDVGPGIMDIQNQREGGSGSSHQMEDGFSGRGGMHGYPPTSQPQNMGGRGGMPPWGPNRGGGMHGDMRGGGGGGWNRGPFRGGPRGRGNNMRGHN